MPSTALCSDSRFSLPPFFEDVRAVVPTRGRAHRVDQLPDGRTALIFRVLEQGRRADLTVVGPRTRAFLKDASGFVRAVRLQFRPGWSSPLLGVPANQLADSLVPLEDLWGLSARVLCSELLAATRVEEVIERTAWALTSRLQQRFQPTSARLARQAVQMLEGDETRIDHVAQRLGITTRHLRRSFMENIGVGPKDFARSVRLQRAVRMTASTGDWGRIAADAGYYDQAHLITEFHALVGLTPGTFLGRTLEQDPILPSPRRVRELAQG